MSQTFTLSEVEQNNGKNGKPIWIIVKGVVYNVSQFLNNHPGGEDTLMDYAGKDATKAFNQVGHSTDAIQDMKLYRIGIMDDVRSTQINFKCKNTKSVTTTTTTTTTMTQPSNGEMQRDTIITESSEQCNGKMENSRKLFCCC